MKKYFKYFFPLIFLSFILLSLILLSCSDPKLDNPFDMNVEIPAPTNLSITQTSVTSCKLTWTDNSTNEQGFRIDRKKDNETWQVGYTEVEANVTEFTEQDLDATSTYSYKVYGFVGDNMTTMIEGSIDMNFPAPTNLQINQTTITSCHLNWEDNSTGEEGFRIDRKKDSESWQVGYAEVGANVAEIVETGLQLNSTYSYRVCGFAGDNTSSSIENSINNSIPAPENLTYTLENISYPTADIHLYWDYLMSGIDGFKVMKNGTLLSLVIPAGTTEWIDVGVNIENSYSYQVVAFYQSYNSGYSNEITTPIICVDIDGNVYEAIQIGDQIWMAENLKVTHYRNGDEIQHETNNSYWANLSTGAYCYYDNDANNADTYGVLYNWYAIEEDDTRGLAPEGWRVPTDDEWQSLVDYLGGSSVAGGKMKEAGTAHWNSPNTGATNESGFTALPGGYRDYYSGSFYDLGSYGYFWSATEGSAIYAWYRLLIYDNAGVYRASYYKQGGFSVRCIRSVE